MFKKLVAVATTTALTVAMAVTAFAAVGINDAEQKILDELTILINSFSSSVVQLEVLSWISSNKFLLIALPSPQYKTLIISAKSAAVNTDGNSDNILSIFG